MGTFPKAKLVERIGDLVSFQFQREDLVVSHLFAVMEEQRASIGVANWGITQTTYGGSLLLPHCYCVDSLHTSCCSLFAAGD